MKRRLQYLALGLLLLALHACNGAPSQRELALQAELDSLRTQAESKERSLQEFMASMDYIQQNLDLLASKERSIQTSVSAAEGEATPQGTRERIEQSMVEIGDIMQQNRVAIARMERLIKQNNLQATGIQRLVDNLRFQVNQRDSTIVALQGELDTLHISMDSLSIAIVQLDSAYHAQTQSVNEAWYAYGTRQELKENKIITRKGGFLGLGKHSELRDDINTDYFTRIDIRETDRIPVMTTGKGLRFLTPHPHDSYELQRNSKGDVVGIQILSKENFWRTSRYLVVEVL